MFFSRLRQHFRRDKPCTVPVDAHEPWQSESDGDLEYVGRSLVMLRPRELYVRWVRGGEPHLPYDLRRAREDDAIVFLMPSHDGSAQESEAFLAAHW